VRRRLNPRGAKHYDTERMQELRRDPAAAAALQRLPILDDAREAARRLRQIEGTTDEILRVTVMHLAVGRLDSVDRIARDEDQFDVRRVLQDPAS
jgi:hypothetical protein